MTVNYISKASTFQFSGRCQNKASRPVRMRRANRHVVPADRWPVACANARWHIWLLRLRLFSMKWKVTTVWFNGVINTSVAVRRKHLRGPSCLHQSQASIRLCDRFVTLLCQHLSSSFRLKNFFHFPVFNNQAYFRVSRQHGQLWQVTAWLDYFVQ